jgi:surface polysaccharide O-acyltransferase-like enzyme
VVACVWAAAVVALPLVATQLENPRGRTESALTMWILYTGLFVAGFGWREPRRTGLRWVWTGLAAVVLLAITIWQYDARPPHVWLNALTPVGAYTPLVTVAAICIFVCVIDVCARFQPSARVQRVLRALGEATFGVFLCHLVFVAMFRKWAPDFYKEPTPLAKTELYLAVVVLAFSVSLVARRIPLVRRVF